MAEPIPTSVIEALDGYPEVGVVDGIIPLITVDDGGYPHVCLLSRAELDADANHFYAVVASTVSSANIRRDGRATLVLFTVRTAYYFKLDVTSLRDDGDLLGIVFNVHLMKEDGDESFNMQPPRYLPDEAVASKEHWERGRSLLRELQVSRIGEDRS